MKRTHQHPMEIFPISTTIHFWQGATEVPPKKSPSKKPAKAPRRRSRA